MSPSGFGTVYFTSASPTYVFHIVLKAFADRWPSMRIRIDPSDKEFTAPFLPTPDDLKGDLIQCFLMRDKEMQKHTDRTGGTAMKDGEGPIQLLHSIHVREPLLVTTKGYPHLDGAQSDFYEAMVCCPTVSMITVVTPDDPRTNSFSAWACDLVMNACLNSQNGQR